MRYGCFVTRAVAAATVLTFLAGTAHGQYALGDGTALDNNLREGSGGVNRTNRSVSESVRLRNALVTGSVPAGFSFRGDVGYQAANDFRTINTELGGEGLGSADLYPELRDSYASFLAARDVRGIYGLQQQFQYAIGGQSDDLTGSLIIDRPGAGTSANQLAPNALPNPDVYGNLRGALRSTSEWQVQRATRPEILSQVLNSGREMYVAASPLQGITTLPTDNPAFTQGLERDETRRRPGQVATDPVAQPVDPGLQSMHATVLESMRVRLETDEELRQRLLSARQPTVTDETESTPDTPESTTPILDELLEEQMINELDDIRRRLRGLPPAESEGEELTEFEEIAKRAAELLGGDGPVVSELRPDIEGGAVYRRHMEFGRQALDEGRWFDAEERFSAALTIKAGDAAAAVGRVHAQIGAGMFLSASINLRNLFEAYPEMIGVRYDMALLPSGDRLVRVRQLLNEAAGKDTTAGRDAALLLAYLGRQYRDNEEMNRGLNRMRAIRSALNLGDDPLETLLRTAWTE
ncbi:MAG: hypothetical protein KDA21_04335 [Phycisphaerales bacterium]|nr:hypothetical protein [Phycisphaerales bacterium]